MPSFHSVGTLPADHTMPKSLCSVSLIGFSTYFHSSGAMPSGPAAFPFFRHVSLWLEMERLLGCLGRVMRMRNVVQVRTECCRWMVESGLVLFRPAVIVLLGSGAYWAIKFCDGCVSVTFFFTASQPFYCLVCRFEVVLLEALFCLIGDGRVKVLKVNLGLGLVDTYESVPFTKVSPEPCRLYGIHDFQRLCREPWTMLRPLRGDYQNGCRGDWLMRCQPRLFGVVRQTAKRIERVGDCYVVLELTLILNINDNKSFTGDEMNEQ